MIPIKANTRGEAWLQAAHHLYNEGMLIGDGWIDYNLVIEISDPGKPDLLTKDAQTEVDSILHNSDESPIHTVAETIFPATEYLLHGSKGVFEIYPKEIFPKIKSMRANKPGTYIQRMVRRQGPNGEINPLKHLVQKLKKQAGLQSKKRACYELGLVDLTDIPIYMPERKGETLSIMGDQCLSHISMKLGSSNELYVTALYRSQYFIRKALGNFLGLARLQAFVANEANLTIGPLVCHATYAKLETASGQWGKTKIKEIVGRLNDKHKVVI